MRPLSALDRRARLAVALLLPLSSLVGLGCGGEPDPKEVGALRRGFPEQAPQVLESGPSFVASEDGFALRRPRLGVNLPRDGAHAIRFQIPSEAAATFEVRVTEIGGAGGATVLGRAIAYRRQGCTSFWTATPGEIEEWLLLDEGASRDDAAVAAWEVEGAVLRQRGEAVEVADGAGVVRLRVTAPVAYAAGGRRIDARLAAQGTKIELFVNGGGEAMLIDPMWAAAGAMGTARYYHPATLLPNGEVLVAGGFFAGGMWLSSTERYNPATNAWSSAAPLSAPRSNAPATLLPSGKVLLAGGSNGPALASGELYDPIMDAWTPAAPMPFARHSLTATLLPNGKVLVAGGYGGPGLPAEASAATYDPSTNTWAAVAPMTALRGDHTATLLPGGKVLVVGGHQGIGGSALASAELYDPTAGTWAQVASMNVTRYQHTATLLSSGKVLAAGGFMAGLSAEVFDPATNTWTPTGALTKIPYHHTATLLSSGQVLLAGGISASYLAAAELYDPATNLWTPTLSMSAAREAHTATLLGDGQVLVAGGFDGIAALASAERFSLKDALGAPCSMATTCLSGFCVDGVCCDTMCNAGPCDGCSVAVGAVKDGTCAPLTGPVCDDADACTHTDTCKSGVCGGVAAVCMALDVCHDIGVCDPQSGMCSNPAKANGSPCPGGTCINGGCIPAVDGGAGGGGGSASSSGSSSSSSGSSGSSSSGSSSSSSSNSSSSGSSGGMGGSGSGGDEGGCGCGVSGNPASGALWIALGLLLAARRRLSRLV